MSFFKTRSNESFFLFRRKCLTLSNLVRYFSNFSSLSPYPQNILDCLLINNHYRRWCFSLSEDENSGDIDGDGWV
ncbi:hypothetical protein ES332_D05G418200v1 [Gossypium tomentosum]|uniref:Uncharacterized protein n=1 Tax=Gossypium tomentosum TaxID=34277 RepID=A0A5D2L6C0_GOSTO|nr:hypothetical protein ES332_D05G418200v1 [Gossypium tomentosum]